MTWIPIGIFVGTLGLVAVLVLFPWGIWIRRYRGLPCQWCKVNPTEDQLCAIYTTITGVPIGLPRGIWENYKDLLWARGAYLCKGCKQRAFDRMDYIYSRGKMGSWDWEDG